MTGKGIKVQNISAHNSQVNRKWDQAEKAGGSWVKVEEIFSYKDSYRVKVITDQTEKEIMLQR